MNAKTVFQWIFAGVVTVALFPPFIFLGFLQTSLTRKVRLSRPLAKIHRYVPAYGLVEAAIAPDAARSNPASTSVLMTGPPFGRPLCFGA